MTDSGFISGVAYSKDGVVIRIATNVAMEDDRDAAQRFMPQTPGTPVTDTFEAYRAAGSPYGDNAAGYRQWLTLRRTPKERPMPKGPTDPRREPPPQPRKEPK